MGVETPNYERPEVCGKIDYDFNPNDFPEYRDECSTDDQLNILKDEVIDGTTSGGLYDGDIGPKILVDEYNYEFPSFNGGIDILGDNSKAGYEGYDKVGD